ncbi:hypothetical protein ACFL27_11780 [candidate division CSSED10-310 bacterium]|uniref:Uncharacterized protein n=1 Tax=candidate division CSSED10-310 bacterium TaxID=2855610 RepID=A0ABV6YXD4_UNCC1
MSEEKERIIRQIDPSRRAFMEKMVKAAYIVPTVVTVSMFNEQLDISTARAASGTGT